MAGEEKKAEKPEKKAVREGKRVRTGRKHESIKGYKFYSVKGETEVVRAKKSCPRCGPGTWLAVHNNRAYCGRCSYTEFQRKESPKVVEKKS